MSRSRPITPEPTPEPGPAPSEPEGPRPAPPCDERRRAAAYIDLWERQIAHAAAQGPAEPRLGRAFGA